MKRKLKICHGFPDSLTNRRLRRLLIGGEQNPVWTSFGLRYTDETQPPRNENEKSNV